jgi:hypothetical protein
MKKILIALILMLLAPYLARSGDVIGWEEAAYYYGKDTIVEGKVVAIKCVSSACFLNFDQNYQATFSAVIFAAHFQKFPGSLHQYLDKFIQVKGVIEKYKGSPQIIVKDQSQITVVDKSRPVIDSEQIVCFQKEELEGGSSLWSGLVDEKCVKRKHFHCSHDTSAFTPYVCWDRRDGSLLLFRD